MLVAAPEMRVSRLGATSRRWSIGSRCMHRPMGPIAADDGPCQPGRHSADLAGQMDDTVVDTVAEVLARLHDHAGDMHRPGRLAG